MTSEGPRHAELALMLHATGMGMELLKCSLFQSEEALKSNKGRFPGIIARWFVPDRGVCLRTGEYRVRPVREFFSFEELLNYARLKRCLSDSRAVCTNSCTQIDGWSYRAALLQACDWKMVDAASNPYIIPLGSLSIPRAHARRRISVGVTCSDCLVMYDQLLSEPLAQPRHQW